MLSGGVTDFGLSQILVKNLQSFALPHRVPCQCHEALCSEGTKHLLPGRVGLASTLMPQGIQYRWVGRMPGSRQVKVRGHVEVRLTLEDDFLDSVPRPLQDPDHSRVQRRSVREASEVLQNLFAYVRPSFVHIFDCGQMLHSTLPLPEQTESNVVQVRR